MKSLRSMLSVSVLSVVTVLAGCAADTTSDESAGNEPSALTAETSEGNVASADANEAQRPGRGPHGPGRRGGGPDRLLRAALHADLGLSAEQKSTLEALMVRPAKPADGKDLVQRPRFDESHATTLAAAIRSGNVDTLTPPAPSAEQKAEHQARREAHRAEAAKKLATLHATLTPAQRSALVAAVEERAGTHAKGENAKGEHGKREHGKGFGPGRHHGAPPFMAMLKDLELTEAQKTALHTAMQANRPAKVSKEERAQKHEAMRAERKQKLASFAREDFDATSFLARAEKPHHDKLGKANPLAALVKVLDAKQRETLAARIEQGPPAGKLHGERSPHGMPGLRDRSLRN